ncbi:mucin-17 [Toxotes jaculatrix]|uniref:mucin-17 n=1 Tax=Toxotes jaculatrix TaxID=941984 RepID=UPI001B3A9140|nr:mucin-17 [Toxotes jaculatrix]
MEGRQLQADSKSLQSFPKLPVWIIEYVWAHKMMDIQEVVEPSDWPEVNSQPLSVEESWRLRVASAQVYSIVKNRDIEHFERVMDFLDATYRLLPRLVAPIKHMKIMFGLKTMVIMWMLREGRGMVDTVVKITQYFPSKLSQYQDHCNQHEMFLMRKNNLDFKTLAQALAMDKEKLADYIKREMGKQYGERYAQKVEDRLLHYLHQLETVLPGDTFADKILKKDSPVTEEEKLLLEVITSDSTTIATTLRKLLHCDAASCRPACVPQSSEHGENETGSSQLSKSLVYGSSSQALLRSSEGRTLLQFQPEDFNRAEEAPQEVSSDSSFLWENDNHSDVGRHQQTQEGGEVIEGVGEQSGDEEKQEASESSRDCVEEAASSPQFCSKHQRWVTSILQECPEECSEELRLQANVSVSPPLFQSSSSTSSSQDLTPSDLIPCPPEHPPSQTTSRPQTAAQVSDPADPKDKLSSGSACDTSQAEALPQASPLDTPLPTLLSPVVRLIDIASVRSSYPPSKPSQTSPDHLIMSNNKQTASTSSPQVLTSPHCHTSRSKESAFDQLETVTQSNTTHQLQTAPVSHDASAFTSCQTQTLQSFSRFSKKLRRVFTNTRQSPGLDGSSQNPLAVQFEKAPATYKKSHLPLPDFSVSWPSTRDASTSASQSGTLSSACTANQITSSTKSSRLVVPQVSIRNHPQKHDITPVPSKTLPRSAVISSASSCDRLPVRSETCRVHLAQLRLSLRSQAVLLQSTLLQPYVNLTRLSTQECYRATEGRSSAGHEERVLRSSNEDEGQEEDPYSSFDPNTLYSSHSSGSDNGDSTDHDPDYKPHIKKKRLLSEYETAGSLNHV